MKKILILGLTSFLVSTISLGGVNLKNGNFYISYSDAIAPGGGNRLEISRTYNSLASFGGLVGWFGFGWGTPFQTVLQPSADGSVVIRENGSGATSRFVPLKQVDARAAAERLVKEYRKKKSIPDTAANELTEEFTKDADRRHQAALDLGMKSNFAVGTKLFSKDRGAQELEKTKTGWVRTFTDGKRNFFDEEGKLVKVDERFGYTIDLKYNKEKRLQNVKDSQGKTIFFEWYPDGFVKSLSTEVGKRKATYRYENKNLVESVDLEGNKYIYTYDSNQHLLTGVTYSDKKKLEITYNKGLPKAVSKIKEKNGEEIAYRFAQDPENPELHYTTYVTRKSLNGKEKVNSYEYELRRRPDGTIYNYRIATDLNGVKTETVYSDDFQQPLKIVRSVAGGKDQVTSFEYDKEGLILKKSSSDGKVISLDYNKKLKKIIKVESNDGSWTKYDYDDQGNLAKAMNHKGKSVLLVYDRRGLITKMVESVKSQKKSDTLTFTYNPLGKPILIKKEGVGSLKVEYNNYGEVKTAESPEGKSNEILQSFQGLKEMIEPSGVGLSM